MLQTNSFKRKSSQIIGQRKEGQGKRTQVGIVTVGLETMNGTPSAGSGCCVRNNRKHAVGGTSQDTSVLAKGGFRNSESLPQESNGGSPVQLRAEWIFCADDYKQ